MRTKIVLVATLWWLLLAILSRLELSSLQRIWTTEEKLTIFFYLPMCIIAGGWISIAFSKRMDLNQRGISENFFITEKIFFALMILFFAQCIVFTPPVLTDSPNDARLEWGIPIVHVLTEISIRVACLTVIGNACVRQKISARDRWILIASIAYTVMVISRSFMLEIIFYWGFASIFSSYAQRNTFKKSLKASLLVVLVVGVFIGFGNWRQGSDFSIVEYGNMATDSNVLAWIFGYFLVNFDNLALLISEQYSNAAFSNTFGSILQTLQLARFEQVDDYLYVGKFNLGTAFRPFILDYGVWIGGLVFLFLWTLVLISPSFCRMSASRYALYALIAYSAFCLPITGRIEQPPYLFALIWILIADQIVLFRRNFPQRRPSR